MIKAAAHDALKQTPRLRHSAGPDDLRFASTDRPMKRTPAVAVQISRVAGFRFIGRRVLQQAGAFSQDYAKRLNCEDCLYAHREEMALLTRVSIALLPFIDGLLDPYQVVTI